MVLAAWHCLVLALLLSVSDAHVRLITSNLSFHTAVLSADKVTRGFRNYVRDLPGTADVWIDNMTDQSHVSRALAQT